MLLLPSDMMTPMASSENKASKRSVAVAHDSAIRTPFAMTILQAKLMAWQIVALLVAIGAIYKWYDQAFAPFYRVHPVISLTIAASFVAYILLFGSGWQAWSRYRQAQRASLALSLHPEAPDTRYFRLDPYVTAAPAGFRREDDAHNSVLRWIRETTRPVLFLSGVSGSGKSSVLDAYVLPILRGEGWRIEQVRSSSDPLPQLEAVLNARLPRGRHLLIVFDQFEEFVILEDRTSAEARRRFLASVQEFRQNPASRACLLFSFRRDYMSDVIGMKIDDLIPGKTFVEIDAFRRDAARRFLENSPGTPAPALVDRLLAGAEALEDVPARFRPVTLNMLGLALQDFDRQVTGRPERLVQGYMEAAITQSEIREIAPRVVESMITNANTKQACTVPDIIAVTGLRHPDVAASLVMLERRGLVRRLDAATELWEISHDFVARQFAVLLGRLQPSPWPRLIMLASPILFALVLAGAVVGIPMYNRVSLDQTISELARMGLMVNTTTSGELSVLADQNFHGTNQSLIDAGPLLAKLPALRTLDLRGMNVTSVQPIAGLTALHSLNLNGTTVTSLEPIQDLTALQSLDFSGTNVESLEPLKGLKALQSLDLSGTTVKSLDPLKVLTALRILDLSDTQVSDLESLKGLTALRTLYLNGTKVTDLKPLKPLTALQTIYLYRTRVTDLDPVKALAAQNGLGLSSFVDAGVVSFQGLINSNVTYVLHITDDLLREFGTFISPENRRELVDGHVTRFRALDDNIVYVLRSDGELWREFGTWNNSVNTRMHIDGNVIDFQPQDAEGIVYVLSGNNVLWREFGRWDNPEKPRQMVDGRMLGGEVVGFKALDADGVYVLRSDGSLWREFDPWTNPSHPAVRVDGDVTSFQVLDANTIFVLDKVGNLLRESDSGHVLVGSQVQAFQAVDASSLYVLDTRSVLRQELNPATAGVKVDGHVRGFQALDANVLLVLDAGGTLWREALPSVSVAGSN
ncbi:MAG: leucine-rich repeat domain-containing protein [Rhodopila sp.]|jgi:hypothetical protein